MPPAGRTKIFVGRLPDGCTNDDLLVLFEKHGRVTECDVINKYGFVHMATEEEADAAIKALNNYNLMGSNISVEQSTSKLHPGPGAPGRARGGPGPMMGGRRFPPMDRDGYRSSGGYGRVMPPKPYYDDGYYDDYRRYSPLPPRDPYYDRPPSYGRERPRPYPSPYERRPLPPDDGYPPRRMMPRDDMYERRPMSMVRDDLFERRRPPPPDYMYARRSPPQAHGF